MMANSTDKTDEQTSATNNAAVDFSHRLADPNLDSSISLVDNIGSMADRANGILSVLFWYFQNPDVGSPPDGVLCMAVDAAIKEISDIKATVSTYCEADIAKDRVQS